MCARARTHTHTHTHTAVQARFGDPDLQISWRKADTSTGGGGKWWQVCRSVLP